MMHIPSNYWFAWISGLLSVALGIGTYGVLGFAQAGSTPTLGHHWAMLAGLSVCTAVFYIAFGAFSMHWFNWRYWIYAPLWNVAWILGFVALGDTWFETLGYGYVALTLIIVWLLVPDGELISRLRTGRRD
jgi:hypothetical protein